MRWMLLLLVGCSGRPESDGPAVWHGKVNELPTVILLTDCVEVVLDKERGMFCYRDRCSGGIDCHRDGEATR